MQLRSKEEATIYFDSIFPQYVKNASYQRAAVTSAHAIFTQNELKILRNKYSLNLLDPRILKIDGQHYFKENGFQEKFADFCQRTSEQRARLQQASTAGRYLQRVRRSLKGVASTEQIKHSGAIATLDDVLADPFEPRVWESYFSALPLLVQNDPMVETGKITPELNILAALTPIYAETPQFARGCAVSLLGPEQLFEKQVFYSSERSVGDNYLFYSPSRLLALCLAYFSNDTSAAKRNIEHALLTLLLQEARHVLRGDLLSQPGYFPGSPNKNQQAAAFFADHPAATVLGFPVASSGELDDILADFNINTSLLHDLGPGTAFGGSEALCCTQVCARNIATRVDLDSLNAALSQPEFAKEKSQLKDAGYQRSDTFLSSNSRLLLQQKSWLFAMLQKMYTAWYKPDLPPRVQKLDKKTENGKRAVNENSGQQRQQNNSGEQNPTPGGGGKVGLNGGDIFELNQRYFDDLGKAGESTKQNQADQMVRKLLSMVNEALREAQVEFPQIDYSKYGGQLKQLKFRFTKARPLPPLRLKLRQVRKDLASANKVEWYRRHYAFPERLDMAHISHKKNYSTDVCCYLDVSGSISSLQLSQVLSVIKQTVAEDRTLTVRLFASDLGEPIHFGAGKKVFNRDFSRLKRQLEHFPSSGTDLQPVFGDIVDTPQTLHIIISDFCFDSSDLVSYQQKIKQKKIIFINLYSKGEQRHYNNQMPLIERLAKQNPTEMRILALKDYTL